MQCTERDTAYWVRTASDREAVRQGCYFDYVKATRVRDFFREFIRHTEAPFAGQPFELLDWQWGKLIAPAFGWQMPDGTRRFKEVECWIPKKNGKSTLAAAIALYLMTCDDEFGAHVYSAASDKKQAALIYNVAANMVRMNPELEDVIKVRDSQKIMRFHAAMSHYEVLSAEGFRNEGYNIHGLLFDELHTQRDRKLWAALRYGSAARRQGIRVVISTAGEYDEELLWWERFNLALAIQENRAVDVHLLPCVYALAEDEDWNDPQAWERVNPSWHHTINQLDFKRDYANAKTNNANESEFLRYRLNKATKFESAWIRQNYWVSCGVPQLVDPDPSMYPVEHGAVDLADNLDLNAFVITTPVTHPTKTEVLQDATGKTKEVPLACVQVEPYFWAPEEAGLATNKQNRERYEKWFASESPDGGPLLRLMKGAVANQDQVEDDIIEIIQWRNLAEIGIDRFFATRFAQSMVLKMRAKKRARKMFKPPTVRLVGYNCPTMNEATRFVEGLIVSGRLLHDNNPILTWMFGNVMATCDSSGNRKLDKSGKSKGKIDGFAALCIAIYCAINQEPAFKTKYDTQKPMSLELDL